MLLSTGSVYVTQIKDPFPSPRYHSDNRTAIIISGQLRVGNYSLTGPHVTGSKRSLQKFFGGDDPPTAIQTHLEHLIRLFAEYGGVDVFLYIPTTRGAQRQMNWTGDPLTYCYTPTIFARH